VSEQVRTNNNPTMWVGWIWFAGIMLVLAGTFNIISGLVALFNDTYFVVGTEGLLLFDLTGWGWLHLLIGIVAVLAGIALFTGALWARIVAVIIAMVNAIQQLLFMPAYPVWSIIMITLDVLIIWAIIAHGDELTGQSLRD
jgi:hypothetical protein